jgi:hypothetical protein
MKLHDNFKKIIFDINYINACYPLVSTKIYKNLFHLKSIFFFAASGLPYKGEISLI